jgi:hypothetical protein
MQVHWTKVALRFWNGLAASERSTLGKHVLWEVLERAHAAGGGVGCQAEQCSHPKTSGLLALINSRE